MRASSPNGNHHSASHRLTLGQGLHLPKPQCPHRQSQETLNTNDMMYGGWDIISAQ